MNAVSFSPQNETRFQQIVAKYERKNSALLPALYLAQEQFGWLSTDVLNYIAERLDMPPVQVHEAVCFYSMFKRAPTGKWCVQVCNNITCTLMGSEGLLKVAREELGVGPGQTTADKMFTLSVVQCLGSCDTAPMLQLNDDYVENLTADLFRKLIRDLKQQPREGVVSAGR